MLISRWTADVIRDIRYALRVLVRAPVFTLVATASLGLGIGGAATVFTLINAIVLRSLPVPNPQQLYAAEVRTGDSSSPRFSWPAVQRARQELQGRAEIAATTTSVGMQLRAPSPAVSTGAERGAVQLVSGEYFALLRQQPQLGRLLTAHDNVTLGAHPVAVISDAYWQRQFARSPAVINLPLTINNTQFTIVGVAPRGFFGTTLGLRGPDVWVPLMMQAVIRYASNASNNGDADPRKPWPPQENMSWLAVFARVMPDVDPDTVAAAMTVQHQRRLAANPSSDADPEDAARARQQRVILTSAARGVSPLREDMSAPLVVLLAMVMVLLAIACGNVASLLFARATAREREIAIRLSIGAGRVRLIRQLLAESLVLAAIGGAVGLFLAAWGRDLLLALFARGATVLDLDTGFDWRVIAFAAPVTMGTGVLVGALPALRGTRVPVSESLKLQSRSVGAERGWRGRLVGKTLVTLQIAFCLLMLVTAASSPAACDRSCAPTPASTRSR